MNEFTVGVPIYNKSHMLHLIIEGFSKNILEPVDYIFIFDGCTDDSEQIFEKNKMLLKGDIRAIKTNNIFQLKTNNILMKELKTDKLIIFQDDMVLNDSNYLNNIRNIFNIYKDSLGIIGSRDGFEKGYSNMYGSYFSGSNRIPLNNGEFKEKSMINIGPIALSKKLINTVGVFDEIYGKGSYEEMEYSLKAKHHHNLTNIVLGVDLIHDKFLNLVKGNFNVNNSSNILSNQLSLNHSVFRQRWEGLAGI